MNSAQLVFDLHKASTRARTGTGVVSLIAIFSLTVSATVAFLVAGGTWMFYQRSLHPEQASAFVQEQQATNEFYLITWFYLAVFACAFILPALFGLTAQAAVLGASGRERRLATLRLIGLSSRQVTRMTIVETGFQALVGITLGLGLSFLLAPFFTRLSFQERAIALNEILLPWWGYLLVAAILFLLALGAAFVGMQRVRVSPLGVARREMPAALKRWRFYLFIAIFVATVVALRLINISSSDVASIIGVISFLLIVFMAINLVSPYILQVCAYLFAYLPGNAHLVACRRISSNARLAWKRSSAIAFFDFLIGYVMVSPLASDGLTELYKEEQEVGIFFSDVSVGILLTLGFGFTITTVSVFLGQASEVFASADLTRSLQLMGVRRRFFSSVALIEIMLPIVIVSLFGFLCGAPVGLVMLTVQAEVNIPARLGFALSLLGAGWLVTFLAVLAVEPLRSRVLATWRRKND